MNQSEELPQGLPDEKMVGKALQYLANTDESYAKAVAFREAAEARWKLAKETGFLESEGTVAERQAKAACSQAATDAMERYEDAIVQLEVLKAKRRRAELVIEVFRTLEASRRKA